MKEVRELYQLRPDEYDALIDNARASQLMLRFAQHLREQVDYVASAAATTSR